MSRMIKVWDVPTRLFHWTMVPVFAGLWFTAEQGGDWMEWHLRLGMLMLVLVLFRVLWGLCGSQTARFGNFLAGPARIRAYLAGQLPVTAQPGHNPLGGWMVLALLANLSLLGFTGWLQTTDMFWGYAWLAYLHKYLGWALLALVALHVGGMLWTSWAHRENLARAMVTGGKAPPGPHDVA